MSEMVARTGWPCSPNTSHSTTGAALGDLGPGFAGLAQAGEVAFHVGEEHWNAPARKALGERLQGHRLARARRAGDQAVPVGHLRQQEQRALAGADEDARFIRHGTSPRMPVAQVTGRAP
jgi:hypothetical protein